MLNPERTYGEFGTEARGVFVAHRYYGLMYHRMMEQCFGNTVATGEGNVHDTSAIFLDDPSQWIFPRKWDGVPNIVLHEQRVRHIQAIQQSFSLSGAYNCTLACAHGTRVGYLNDALVTLQEIGRVFSVQIKLLVIDSSTHTQKIFGTKARGPHAFYERAQKVAEEDNTLHILFSQAEDTHTMQQEIAEKMHHLLSRYHSPIYS